MKKSKNLNPSAKKNYYERKGEREEEIEYFDKAFKTYSDGLAKTVSSVYVPTQIEWDESFSRSILREVLRPSSSKKAKIGETLDHLVYTGSSWVDTDGNVLLTPQEVYGNSSKSPTQLIHDITVLQHLIRPR